MLGAIIGDVVGSKYEFNNINNIKKNLCLQCSFIMVYGFTDKKNPIFTDRIRHKLIANYTI